jgi:hypothetical protein
MFACVSTYQGFPNKRTKAPPRPGEHLPRLHRQDGYEGVCYFVSIAAAARGISIPLWESEEAM